MRQVFSSQDFTEVGYYKSILDEAGIASFIRNENTGNPVTSGAMFLPSLCVVKNEDYDNAIRLLKSRQQIKEVNEDRIEWTCLSCSEKNPPNFELCWNCKSLRPNI